MPIQWYRQPDGTWVLWNTDESDAPPMQAGPAPDQPSPQQAQAQQMLEDQQGAADGSDLSPYGFKLKPTSSDRQFVRGAIKDLQKGDLTEEERHKLAMSMLEQNLYSVSDDGSVYGAFKRNPGGKGGTQAILDLIGGFKESADNELGALGIDTGQLSTHEIINLYRNKDALTSTPTSESMTTSTEDWKQNIGEQMESMKRSIGALQ